MTFAHLGLSSLGRVWAPLRRMPRKVVCARQAPVEGDGRGEQDALPRVAVG